ncbi:cation-transporting P-type ATPase, partial [Morganella morganii]
QYMLLVLLIAAVTWFVTNDAQAMLAVLVAACPCALVLSAPATAIAGIAVAARHGILIRSSAFLEELADLTSLVVDKTGTLTHGSLRLQAQRLQAQAAMGQGAGLVDHQRSQVRQLLEEGRAADQDAMT